MKFLETEHIEQLHRLSLTHHGGSDGIRSSESLEAALAQVRQVYHYEKPDFYGLAAAYAYYLASAHPYIDGNKRIAISAALVFLKLNGVVVINTNPDDLYPPMIDVASGKMDRHELAVLFRNLIPTT